MRYFLIILFSIVLIECKKDKAEIPELIDLNPKVTKIKTPGLSGYNVIKINYNGELITNIRLESEPESSDFIDSVRFYYSNNQLDSAIRIEKRGKHSFIDSTLFLFDKDSNGGIITVKQKSLLVSNDTVYFHLRYDKGKLSSLKCYLFVDSIIYDENEKIIETREYSISNSSNYFVELINRLIIKSTIERPNPLNIVYKRLGFPYFRTILDINIGRNGYSNNCILDFIYETKQTSMTVGRYSFEYDDKGRIMSLWNEKYPENKDIIEYQ